jgi:RNA methyltransferase, TrmH family
VISKNEIKFIRSLHQKKFRTESNRFFIEGKKLLEEALLHHPSIIEQVFATKEVITELGLPFSIQVEEISNKELEQISALKHPQGLLAVCRAETVSNPIIAKRILVLDGVQDPGNMGTILRTAAWFGMDEVICSRDTVEIFNPKVVQATMGAIFHLPISYTDLAEFLSCSQLPIYGAVMNGENVYSTTIPNEFILILGNEGNGIRPEIEAMIQHPITIPKLGKGESLNVGVAAAVLLSEFSRP